MEKTFQDTVDQLIEVQIQQNPAIEPFRHIMVEFINRYMSYESVKEDMVALYADTFSRNEIYEIVAFYKTPTGQKTIKELPRLASKGTEVGLKRIKNHKDELREMIEKESVRLRQNKTQ